MSWAKALAGSSPARPTKKSLHNVWRFFDTIEYMQITSQAFSKNTTIPLKYTQFGDNINPPLQITEIPENAVSLVIIMDDPDIPVAAGVPVWDHWLVFNIPPTVNEISESWNVQGVRGAGTRGLLEYSGPKPPDKEHRYFFKVYALNTILDLREGATKREIEIAMENHVVAQAELIGLCAPH